MVDMLENQTISLSTYQFSFNQCIVSECRNQLTLVSVFIERELQIYIYIYIYIERERERKRERERVGKRDWLIQNKK